MLKNVPSSDNLLNLLRYQIYVQKCQFSGYIYIILSAQKKKNILSMENE